MTALPRRRSALAAALGVALALAGARAARADATPAELSVITWINQERAALGRGPLGSDVRLFNAAEGHATWMCANQTLSHTGSGGSTPGGRVTAAGYSWFAVGETIGQGFPTAQDIVDGWHGSPPHWTILTSATYRDIGVGYVACDGRPRRHYWAAIVANSRSAATPVGAPPPAATPTSTRTATRTAAAPAPTATRVPPTATFVLRTATRTATARPTATRTPTRLAAPSATAATGGGTLTSRVTLQGRALHGGTTIYVNGAPVAVTADDGSFTVRGIAAGYKTVRARRYGYLDAAVQASVFAGATTQLPAVQLPSGDTHVDQRVTAFDSLVVQLRYGACVGGAAYAAHVDLDGSGCIGPADLALVTVNLGRYGPVGWR